MFRRVIPLCSRYVVLSLLLLSGSPSKAQAPAASEDTIHLPSSKNLILPIPGDPHVAGGFPTTVALHPSGRYVALLDGGYGMHESDLRQGIAVLDLQTNRITHSADPRLGFRAQQTYFLGLSFDRSGEHLFASIASITDPLGKMRGNTGNGIAVYTFARGTVKPERFLPIPPIRGSSIAFFGKTQREADPSRKAENPPRRRDRKRRTEVTTRRTCHEIVIPAGENRVYSAG